MYCFYNYTHQFQMHSQFMEQRQRLASEVELSTKTNCHFSPPRHLFPSSPPPPSSPSTRRSSPRRATPPFKTPPHHKTPPRLSSPQKSSPLKGSPVRQQERQQVSSPGGSGQQPLHGRKMCVLETVHYKCMCIKYEKHRERIQMLV